MAFNFSRLTFWSRFLDTHFLTHCNENETTSGLVHSLAILKLPATNSVPGSDNINKLSTFILTCTTWGDDGWANTKQCILNLPADI